MHRSFCLQAGSVEVVSQCPLHGAMDPMEKCWYFDTCGQGTIHTFTCPEPNCPGRGSNRSRISICLSAQCQARGCPFCHRPALSDDVLTRSELLSRDATTESQVANVLRPQVEWSNTGSVTTPHTPREVSVTGGVENEETSGAYLFLLDLKLLGRAFLVGFFL